MFSKQKLWRYNFWLIDVSKRTPILSARKAQSLNVAVNNNNIASCKSQEKLETMLMQNVFFFFGGGEGGGVNKVYYGNVKIANNVERVVSKLGQLQPRFTSVTRNRQTWGRLIISICSIQNPLILYTSKVVWKNFILSCFSTHFSLDVPQNLVRVWTF